MDKAKDKNKKIEFTVRHSGMSVELSLNANTSISKVLDKALKELEKEFGFQPPENERPFLRFGDIQLDDLEKTLEEYNIGDGAIIDLLLQHVGG